MNYYVIWPDGRRFGPADLAMLNAWAREGRLIPSSQLEETGTGRRFPAHELPGLVFPTSGLSPSPPWSQPQAPGQQPGMPGAQGPAQGPFSGPSQPQGPAPQQGMAGPRGPFSGPSQPQPPGSGPLPGYYRPQYGGYRPQSSGSLTSAWVLGTVSVCAIFLCCCTYGIGSIVGVACAGIGMAQAKKAKLEGYPNAQNAWILNLVGVIVCSIVFVVGIIMLAVIASGGFGSGFGR